MEQNDLQRALMAVLFAAGEPVDAKRLSQTLEHDEDEIHAACKALMDELSYTRSGIRIAGGITLANSLTGTSPRNRYIGLNTEEPWVNSMASSVASASRSCAGCSA